jgi:hypothetical protein
MSPVRVILGSGLLAFLFVYYGFLLTAGRFDLWYPGEGLGLTFNSMLEHLLRGEFDVDPSTVGKEGFYRDGRTFAYWGILHALFRLPLLLFPGGLHIDVTPLSCLVAVCVAACVKLLTLRQILLNTESSPARTILGWALGLSILFAGAQIEFLRISLYQEVCLWAGALGAVFVYCAVVGILRGRFGRQLLCAMAIAAGLTLLARVSVAVGLYAAMGLLLVFHLRSRAWLMPAAILVVFAALAAVVNFYRWDHPLVFANYHLYLMNEHHPDRLPRTELYGLFNIARIPFGLVYYFFPIWIFHRADGRLFFEEYHTRLMDQAELPPSSFLLTDPLLFFLGVVLLVALVRNRLPAGLNKHHVLAVLVGLSASAVLMLCAISMSFRYRIDFYPFIEFSAFIGAVIICRRASTWSIARLKAGCVVATMTAIAASHFVLVLHKLSLAGPSIAHLRPGIVHLYADEAVLHPSLKRVLRLR